MDWFYGFKPHLAINDRGEILNIALNIGNVDEWKPVRQLLQRQSGNFYGNKGCISKALALELRDQGIVLITKFKKTFMSYWA